MTTDGPIRYVINRLKQTKVNKAVLRSYHDDVIKWKHFPRYLPFVRGIHRSGPRWIPHTKASDFDVFFGLRPNKRLSKQSWGSWFETPPRPLWCHCNMGCSLWHQWRLSINIWRYTYISVKVMDSNVKFIESKHWRNQRRQHNSSNCDRASLRVCGIAWHLLRSYRQFPYFTLSNWKATRLYFQYKQLYLSKIVDILRMIFHIHD